MSGAGQDLSAWSALAENAGFRSWEHVVSVLTQECPSASEELFKFLSAKADAVRKAASEAPRVHDDSKRGGSTEEESGERKGARTTIPTNDPNDKAAGSKLSPSLDNTGVSPKAVRLNIGGTYAKEGWCIVNTLNLSFVDVVGSCTDLSHFQNETVQEVYSSHCFEHLGYQSELPMALKEVLRVLVPGGSFKCSVPNLEVLCDIYLKAPRADSHGSRFAIMRMIYGGQVDAYDFHKVGFDLGTLEAFMRHVGFASVVQVSAHGFGEFEDTSSLAWHGTPISLNVIAYKALAPDGVHDPGPGQQKPDSQR